MSGAVDRALRQNATEDMNIDTVLSNLDLGGLPVHDDVQLVRQRQSLTMTVFADAWRSAGHTLDEPGSVHAYWFEDDDILIVDLNNDD